MKYPRDAYYRMRPGRFAVLKTLYDWFKVHQYYPTLAVVAEVLGCSRQNVYCHLARLVEDGLVDKPAYGRYIVNHEGRKYLRECQDGDG